MTALTESEPVLAWAWEQALVLYKKITVFITTPRGMSAGYHVGGGIIQGGGMDPLWFAWFTLAFAVWAAKHLTGVPLITIKGNRVIRAQAVVDDTTIFANSVEALQTEAEAAVQVLKNMNMRVNEDKFALLHHAEGARGPEASAKGVRLGGFSVGGKPKGEYVRLLGGNANVLAQPVKDLVELGKGCVRVQSRLRAFTPSSPITHQLVQGIIINKWVYRKLVDWPGDVLGVSAWHPPMVVHKPGETESVHMKIASLYRRTLQLPLKTPKSFLYRPVTEGGLGCPLAATILWVRCVAELMGAANSAHDDVRDSTQAEVLFPTDGGKGGWTDYQVFCQWCAQCEWEPRLVGEGSAGTGVQRGIPVTRGHRWAFSCPPPPLSPNHLADCSRLQCKSGTDGVGLRGGCSRIEWKGSG